MSATYGEQRTKREVAIDEATLARVKEGLKWLEKTHGPGWEDKIDLGTLDLSMGSRCVLGQVYGAEAARTSKWEDGYWYAREKFIGEGDDDAADLGFNTYEDGDLYGPLQAAWEYVLELRVKQEA